MISIKNMNDLSRFPQLYEAVKKTTTSFRIKMNSLVLIDADVDRCGAELYFMAGDNHLDISINSNGEITDTYYDGEDEC